MKNIVYFLCLVYFYSYSVSQSNNALKLDEAETWVNLGDFDISGTALTIEALIYMETKEKVENIDGLPTQFSPTVVTKHFGPENLNYLFRPTLFAVSTSDSPGGGLFLATNSMYSVMELEKWYHIAGVYDGNHIYFYLNGCLVGKSSATGTLDENNFDTAIGNGAEYISNPEFQDQFVGKLAEVRFWNVARTAEEIQNNMFDVDPSSTGLLAYYSFESSDGTTVSIDDISPNDRNGLWGIDADGVTVNEGERSDLPPSTKIPTNNIAELIEDEIVNESDFVWNGNTSGDFTTLDNWLVFENNFLTPATSGFDANSNIIIPNEGGCTFERSIISESSTINIRDLHITTDAILELENNTTVNINGDYFNYGSIVSTAANEQLTGNRLVRFTGTTNQYIYSGGDLNTSTERKYLHNIEINKPSGDLLINEFDLSFSGDLTMTEGDIDLNGHNINLTESASIVNESNNSRIKGFPGYIQTTRDYSTPLSSETFGNLGISISTAISPGEVTIQRGHERQTGIEGNQGIERYFIIDAETNEGLDASMSFYYFNDEVPTGFNLSELALYRSVDNGSSWAYQQESIAEIGFVTLSNITSFSHWTVSDHSSSPLPVEMKSFQAKCNNSEVILNWITASELNASHFDIEESIDGVTWDFIDHIEAQGTTPFKTKYEYKLTKSRNVDIKYYRLHQFDFDGQSEIFGPISAPCNTSDEHFVLFPNPTTGKTNLNFTWGKESQYLTLQITDMTGRVIFQDEIIAQVGSNHTFIDLNNFQKGIYNLTITNKMETVFSNKILKQ